MMDKRRKCEKKIQKASRRQCNIFIIAGLKQNIKNVNHKKIKTFIYITINFLKSTTERVKRQAKATCRATFCAVVWDGMELVPVGSHPRSGG